MRRPCLLPLWVLASLIVSMATLPAVAAKIAGRANEILDTLGVRADQPLGASARPGTVIKAAVVSPDRLVRYGFPNVPPGAPVVIRVTGEQKFVVELPESNFSKTFSVDQQGKLTQ